MPRISIEQAKGASLPKTTLQTIEIPKTWTLTRSRAWLKHHGYYWQEYRTTTHFRRFWQTAEILGAHYYSKKLPDGIVLTWQRY